MQVHQPRPHADAAYGNDNSGTFALSLMLRYVYGLVRRDLVWILLILGAAVAAAVVLTMLDTPRYTAATTVQINDQSEKVLGDELDSETNVNSGWDVERFLNTQLEILQSDSVARRVAKSLNLANDPRFYTAMEMPPPQDSMSAKLREDLVINLLDAGMSSSLPRDTRIAIIEFTSADPEYSAKIANAFSEEFIQSSLQRRFDSSAYARTFIADQLQEARSRLEASEREVNAYAREAGLIRSRGDNSSDSSAATTTSVTADSLRQLNQSANVAQAARVAAEARWRAEAAQPLLSSTTVLANPAVQDLLTRRSEARARLETLRSRYLDDYPEIQQLQAEVDSIDSQLSKVAQSIRDSVRADYTAANAVEDRLRQQVEGLQGETLAEQDRSVRYNTLAREADTNRSIYDGLLQRFRELNASAGIANSNMSVIDRAEPPMSPSSPSLFKNLLMALVAGFALAGAFVFLRDQFDDAIRVPEDVENKVRLPLLGIIPTSDEGSPDSELEDPKSPISEAYNSLRGQLLYSTPDGLPKIVLVTSSQPSEGKTTTSNAIAQGFARMGKKVVLIDADLRRPSEHKRHSLSNEVGLSSLLTGSAEVSPQVVHTVSPNFDVLTSGPIPPSPTELLSGPRLARLLEVFSETYDLVVLDSAPVLGLADAPLLSALADGVVFVIEADRGRGGMLKTALRRLRAMDPVMLGAVLTKFDVSKAANKYSEYSGYEYYRYAGSDGHD